MASVNYSFPDIYFMDFKLLPASFVERKLKAIAVRYAKANNLHYQEGLQAVARHYGFKSWNDMHDGLHRNQYKENRELAVC